MDDSQAVFFEVDQLNTDLKLVLEDFDGREVVQVSIPSNEWISETLIVQSKDCIKCLLKIEAVAGVDRAGSYQLKLNYLSYNSDIEAIEIISSLNTASKLWLDSIENIALLKSVYEQYTNIASRKKFKESVFKDRVNYLASQVTHLLQRYEDQKNYVSKILDTQLDSLNQYHLRALYSSATFSFNKGNLDASLKQLELAKEFALKQNNQLMEAAITSHFGLIASEKGQSTLAVEYFNTAYQVFTIAGDWRRAIEELINLGWSNYRLGEMEQALNYYNQARSFSQLSNIRYLEVEAGTGGGVVYKELGDIDQALKYIDAALDISVIDGNDFEIHARARALQAKAQVLLNTGMNSLAKIIFEESLLVYKKGGFESDQMNIRYFLGIVHSRLGDYKKAEFYASQVLEYDRKSGNPFYLVTSLDRFASLALTQKNYKRAIEYQEQALANISEIDDNKMKGRMYSQSAFINFYAGMPKTSERHFEHAVHLNKESKDFYGQILTSYRLAKTLATRGDRKKAESILFKLSDKLIKSRNNISREDLRQGYLSLHGDIAELQIQLRNDKSNEPLLGLEIAEKFRSRTLNERLIELKGRRTLTFEQLSSRKRIEKELELETMTYHQLSDVSFREKLLKRVKILTDRMERLEASYRITALDFKDPLEESIEQMIIGVKENLENNELALYFDTQKEKSFMWAVSRSRIQRIELPPSNILEKQIEILLDYVRVPPLVNQRDRKKMQMKYVEILSASFFSQLDLDWNSFEQITIIPDGPLHYLPFSLLKFPGESKLLLQEKQLTYAPSFSIYSKFKNKSQGNRKRKILLVIANPEMDKGTEPVDSLVATRGGFASTELPFTAKEAKSILKSFKHKSWFLNRDKASKNELFKLNLADFEVLHFATHGLASNESSALSGLVLSNVNDDNNLLLAPEISHMALDAELVVLSGCETAIGQQIKGEGLFGLSRAFFEAGSNRVIASLWSVQDAATAELMGKFYEFLMVKEMSPRKALQQAKLHVKNFRRKNGQKPWKDPFYWAGFVLQGSGDSWIE